MYFYDVATTPKERRLLAELVAPDPWTDGKPAAFSLVEYDMISTGRAVGGRSVGLRCERNGEERLIPEALYELWRTGEVEKERLPSALHDHGARFRPKDAQLILTARQHLYALVVFLALAIGPFGGGLWMLWLEYKLDSHVMHVVPLAELGTQRHDGEAVWTQQEVPVLETVKVATNAVDVPHLVTRSNPHSTSCGPAKNRC